MADGGGVVILCPAKTEKKLNKKKQKSKKCTKT